MAGPAGCQIFPSAPPATTWQIWARIRDGPCQHAGAMPASADVAASLGRRSSHVAPVSLPQLRSLRSSKEAEPSSELPRHLQVLAGAEGLLITQELIDHQLAEFNKKLRSLALQL